LTQLGFSDTFIHELARIAMKTNYGQDVDIQGFVGAVSLAGAQGGLWAVEGGNFRVAESAFEASKAVFKAARVTSIDEAASGRGKHFHVTYSLKEELDDFLSPLLSSHTEDFDAVVLAIPCTSKDCGDLELKVWRVEEKFQHFPDAYQRTVAVFVKGYVDHSQFGVGSSQDFPDCLFSITDGLIFNSLCRQVPVDFKPAKNDSLLPSDFNVWKIFCPAPWTVHHVNRFFVNHSDFVVQDWLAYPKYTKLSSALPPFVLDEHGGLVSINAVEAAASAMEQSVIGAKNAALLIKKFLEK
jgi:prenylcysteine oxidase/farnesylcysteine lyase